MNNIKYLVVAGLIMLGLGTELQAQDPVFSQYQNSPTMVNPAYTGLYNGTLRANLQYRDQWGTVLKSNPYRTLHASLEYKWNVFNNDFIAASGDLVRDEAGVSRYTITRSNLGLAYHKKMFGSYGRSRQASYLIASAQLGLGEHRLAHQGWFGNQFDVENLQVNTALASGDTPESSTGRYASMNAGILWFSTFDDRSSFYAGASMYHINEPTVSFLQDIDEVLERRLSIQVGGEIPISEELSLLPSMVYMDQRPSMQLMGGVSLRYAERYWDDMGFRFGTYTRIASDLDGKTLNDAIILLVGFEMPQWKIGISYDISTSPLIQSNDGRGAIELGFQYFTAPRDRRSKVECPRF